MIASPPLAMRLQQVDFSHKWFSPDGPRLTALSQRFTRYDEWMSPHAWHAQSFLGIKNKPYPSTMFRYGMALRDALYSCVPFAFTMGTHASPTNLPPPIARYRS
jgi:hypothetical protein